MGDDRDKRRPQTPPAGVRAQIAPPSEPENWEDKHTGVTPVHAPTGSETPLQTVVRRSGETKNIAIDVHAEVGTLHSRVSTLETKVDGIGTAVEEQGKQNKQIIGLTSDVISILKGRETVTTTTQLAQVEVTKSRALTENELARERELVLINDEKETKALQRDHEKASKALRREWAKKTFERFALPILAAIATYIVIKLTGG